MTTPNDPARSGEDAQIRALAQEIDASPDAVRKAIHNLERRGLIKRIKAQ